MPDLSRTIGALRPGVFAELQARIDAHAGRGGDLVPLQIGDTFLDPAPAASLARACDPDRLEPELYRYGATLGLAALRDALAARVRARGLPWVEGDAHVLLGAGATHAISCAARAILDDGDDVLLATPYWPLAHGILHGCGARAIEVPFTSRLYADPSLDAGALLCAALTPRTKALYVITPNNPDGKVLTRAQLGSIAALAIERDLWVIADEAYADYAYDAPHVSVASLPGMAERTITALSLSKSHALAGVRVGCVVAPPAVVRAARKAAIHSTFNVPVIAQRSALGALLAGEAWTDAARAEYRGARDAAMTALEGSGVRFGRAEGGAYLFLDFVDVLDRRPLSALLAHAIDRGVLLAPGEAFGAAHATCARLCFIAVPRPRLLEGIARLRAAIDAF
ncbi:MAG: arginine--pyruvate transaminase AruH [Polyangiales bacterium]